MFCCKYFMILCTYYVYLFICLYLWLFNTYVSNFVHTIFYVPTIFALIQEATAGEDMPSQQQSRLFYWAFLFFSLPLRAHFQCKTFEVLLFGNYEQHKIFMSLQKKMHCQIGVNGVSCGSGNSQKVRKVLWANKYFWINHDIEYSNLKIFENISRL